MGFRVGQGLIERHLSTGAALSGNSTSGAVALTTPPRPLRRRRRRRRRRPCPAAEEEKASERQPSCVSLQRQPPVMNKSEMADEALFLLLHNEMVSGLYRAAEQGDGAKGEDTHAIKEISGGKNCYPFLQGIYVLQDNKFRLLTQISAGKQYLEHAPKYLAFTCGLIRGALSNLGIKSIVTAEVSTMPACKFQVMIQKI
ncbi:hypothetical protein JD844_021052 [Phrynosoma platyrhinos]|uniref:Trafficking protein particle complex 6B n=1 Tax=Phrynosoma platyrhinos TaxID=52577 RepID=A0ABQ7ST60_PHRPL|nr:hypothetical protein JD844_021052 [Phrynosoma platyrhinos]